MAIVQTGATLTFPALGALNAGTVSSTINVPADAEIAIAAWSGYSTTAGYFTGGSMTLTKGAVDTAMIAVPNGDALGGSAWAAPAFYLVLPDTGSNKTLKWDWSGAAAADDASSLCSVTFWKGIDTSSPVRNANGAQSSGSTPYTTPTLTAVLGDLIVAWIAAFAGGAEGTANSFSNLSLLTQITKSGTADGAWATGSPSGNVAVACSTDTGWDDGGISAIVLKPAASGDTLQGATPLLVM